MSSHPTPSDRTSAGYDAEAFVRMERHEKQRRWQATLRELGTIVERVTELASGPVDKEPRSVAAQRRSQLRDILLAAIGPGDHPELKRSVARRMADKMGQYLLSTRLFSVPVLHEIEVLLPWWSSQLPIDAIARLRDIGLSHLLNGLVLPVQGVWHQVLTAEAVFLGHCACRSAGAADDLRQNGAVVSLVDDERGRQLLDRYVDCYETLRDEDRLGDTESQYLKLGERLLEARAQRSPDYRLETLFEATHPNWEILPVAPRFGPDWLHAMHANRKAHAIHRELVFELATCLYLARGTVFTSMRLLDTPYTICCCPTPEMGGGCVLTNWYYHGQSNASLYPNDTGHGRRRDAEAQVLPCRYFSIRSQRECLGCGCQHDRPEPRDADRLLEEADQLLAAHR